MELSVIVTSYRNPKLLKLCLDSLWIEMAKEDWELIVADSATEEDTHQLMREDYPQARFLPFEKNVGFHKLVNSALEIAQGKFQLVLNGDIIVTPGALGQMLAFMRTHPRIGILGPKLLNFNGGLQSSCFRFYKPWTILFRRTPFGRLPFAKRHLSWFLMQDCDHEKNLEVDWLMGSALMLRTSALQKVGFMDERFFMYMEDVDWCRRFWEQGYQVVYYPKVSLHHYHGKGSARGGILGALLFNWLTWVHIASAVKYFLKYWNKQNPHLNSNCQQINE